MENVQKILQNLGLTKHEAKIYVALIELGPSLIAHIARHAGLHRPTIYKTLPSLREKTLISAVSKKKQKWYVAESPNKLRAMIALLKEKFEVTLPELQAVHDLQKKRPLVKFLEGRKGIQFVLNDLLDTLKRGEVYCRYSSHKAALAIEKYIPTDFRERRDAKQLERFMITDKPTEQQKKPSLNRFHKLVPKEAGLFDDNTAELIYANKVAFADFNSETVVLIENPTITAFQKKIFKILYNLL